MSPSSAPTPRHRLPVLGLLGLLLILDGALEAALPEYLLAQFLLPGGHPYVFQEVLVQQVWLPLRVAILVRVGLGPDQVAQLPRGGHHVIPGQPVVQDGDRDRPRLLVGPARLVEQGLEEVVGFEPLNLTQNFLPDFTLQK